ncbi:unnamed protein product, partial [Didymodactylos carnosus]
VITRGNNVYGKYQYTDKVIPKFITAILNGKKMTIHGDGKHVRNFIHVDDTVAAIELILCKGKPKMIYNVGSKDEMKVIDIAAILLKFMKSNFSIEDCIVYVKDRCFNDCRYSLVTSALEGLGWKQMVSFEEGLQRTIDWYTTHPNYWKNKSI